MKKKKNKRFERFLTFLVTRMCSLATFQRNLSIQILEKNYSMLTRVHLIQFCINILPS